MATNPAPAIFAALVLGCAALSVCPWGNRGRDWHPSGLTASTWGPPFSEQGIVCPIDDR
jgi:hypothetical protein